MKDKYVNELTGEPYYISPEYDPTGIDDKNASDNRKRWQTFDKVVLLGVSVLGSAIGAMIGAMLIQ